MKERYSYDYFIDGAVFIDTENDRDMDMDTACSLLNKQDNRIKELAEENQQLKEQLSIKMEELHIAYCGIEDVKTKNGNLKAEIKEIKQSQKQLAIEKLQRLKENILRIDKTEIKTLENGYSTLYVDRPEIINEINRQIKELAGKKMKNNIRKPTAQYELVGSYLYLVTPERNYHFIASIGGVLDGKRK